MDFIDFKRQFKYLYSPKPGIPEIVNVPLMQFLMIDGKGTLIAPKSSTTPSLPYTARRIA